MAVCLIDSSVWIAYLRPKPDPKIVKAVQRALGANEAAVAAPIVVEILSGVGDPREYQAREAEFRVFPHVSTDGEAAYVAARIGEALTAAGKRSKTVDLLLAAAAILAGAELWSLADQHFDDIRALIRSGNLDVPGPFRLVILP